MNVKTHGRLLVLCLFLLLGLSLAIVPNIPLASQALKNAASQVNQVEKVSEVKSISPPEDSTIQNTARKTLTNKKAGTLKTATTTSSQIKITRSIDAIPLASQKDESLSTQNSAEQPKSAQNNASTTVFLASQDSKSPTLENVTDSDSNEKAQTASSPSLTPPPADEEKAKPVEKSETVAKDIPTLPKTESQEQGEQGNSEVMPSFDEWKKMMLAQQDLGSQKEAAQNVANGGRKIIPQKRKHNYASAECGAKVIATNAEAEGSSRILNGHPDEYMLNPCKAKIWFVIELCEAIQTTQVELGNFELFSSSPKEFSVFWSDRFPTRDWYSLGTFTALDQRILQSYSLHQEGFGKFIRVEMESHYGSQHYCPLSMVRVFGASMVDEYDALETDNTVIRHDDDDRLDIPSVDDSTAPPKNLFGSARDAVISIVKKATQVLSRDEGESESKSGDSNYTETGEKFVIKPLVASSWKYLVPLFQMFHCCQVQDTLKTHVMCRYFYVIFGLAYYESVCHHITCDIPYQKFVVNEILTDKPEITSEPFTASKEQTETLDELKTVSPILASSIVLPRDQSVNSEFISLQSSTITEPSSSFQESSVIKEIKPTPTLKNPDSGSFKIDTSSPQQQVKQLDSNTINVSIQSSTTEEKPNVSSFSDDLTEVNLQPSVEESIPTVVASVPTIGTSVTIQSQSSDVPNNHSTFVERNETSEEQPKNVSAEQDVDFGAEDLLETLAGQGSENGGLKVPNRESRVQIPLMGQKESVFMRLSNRIKVLEVNMTLSSQYLEQLSQRYRKQMEEMQKAFNRTINALNETAAKAAEKDIQQQEILFQLQLQVSNLTKHVDVLLKEKNFLHSHFLEVHLFFMFVELIVMITILSLYVRRLTVTLRHPNESVSVKVEAPTSDIKINNLNKVKSNSIDFVDKMGTVEINERRHSDDLSTKKSYSELMIVEPSCLQIDALPKVRKKNKSKKNKGNIPRSASAHSLENVTDTSSASSLAGSEFAVQKPKNVNNARSRFNGGKLCPDLKNLTKSNVQQWKHRDFISDCSTTNNCAAREIHNGVSNGSLTSSRFKLLANLKDF